MDHDDIIAVIKSALDLIRSAQQSDGGFVTLSSADLEDFSDSESRCTILSAANILGCLNSINETFREGDPHDEILEEIKKSVAGFLIAEKSARWSFNYWTKSSKEREATPYPDDLDDTFRALDALYEHDKTLIDGAALGTIIKILTAVETEPGGPYKTWFVGPNTAQEWRDVDMVVNSAIGRFLSKFQVRLPGLEKYIENKIENDEFSSPYYPGQCHVAYFISRFYAGPEKGKIVGKLFEERNENGSWANQLETAMAFSALMNLGFKESVTEADIDKLVDDIKENGFQACALCIDPSRDGKKCYAGSSAITAAFVAEALSQWIDTREKGDEVTRKTEEIPAAAGKKLLEQIKLRAWHECKNLPQSLRRITEEYLEKISNEEIVLVPYRMRDALGDGVPDPVNDAYMLESLALGNLYGWMAYTIYDDMLDGNGEPRYLPVANFFLRQLIYLYREIGYMIGDFDSWCERLMNSMDNANTWEVVSCRWDPGAEAPVNLKLADEEFENRFAARSMAHALPAIGVLLNYFDYTNSPRRERDLRSLLSFFRHYLIAKQWHDDAHDCGDDLAHGRMTPVLRNLLSAYQKENPGASLSAENKKDFAALRQFFWREEIQNVAAKIDLHVQKAREALARMCAIKNPEALASILDPLSKSASNTLRERDQTLRFLDAYAEQKR